MNISTSYAGQSQTILGIKGILFNRVWRLVIQIGFAEFELLNIVPTSIEHFNRAWAITTANQHPALSACTPQEKKSEALNSDHPSTMTSRIEAGACCLHYIEIGNPENYITFNGLSPILVERYGCHCPTAPAASRTFTSGYSGIQDIHGIIWSFPLPQLVLRHFKTFHIPNGVHEEITGYKSRGTLTNWL